MKWETTGMLSPGQSITSSNTNWIAEDNRNPRWTRAENKMFENALALYDQDTPDRWKKVASMIPGKTVGDILRQYQQLEDDVYNIEAGLVSVPDYYHTTNPSSSSFTLDCWANFSSDYDPWNEFHRKRASSMRPASENERKKGVPWTEEEHKLFLMGLKKHGKGDWRNISRNFVVTRTPTQVASHAQKYFIRQLSGGGGKDKRRASIHDITTVNLTETSTRTARNKIKKSSSCSSSSSPPETRMNMMMPSSQSHSPSVKQNNSAETQFQWTQQQQQQPMDALSKPVFDDELFMSNFYGICEDSSSHGNGDDSSSFDFRIEDQDPFSSSLLYHGSSSYLESLSQNMVFPMP
ncbi:hypothetical protein QN277_018318 [Acacia crassicarpa]|nr:hypothetical protein QN277_018318 [Acacia crassicarpa]